jgi:hypothetical protein
VNTTPLLQVQSSGLSLDRVVVAQPTAPDPANPSNPPGQPTPPKLQPVTDVTFSRGDRVYLVLSNVGGLTPGQDRKHRLELNLQVQDPQGKQVYFRQNLLGNSGHQPLAGNRAAAPYVMFATEPTWATGNYTATVSLRDQIGRGYITVRQVVILK